MGIWQYIVSFVSVEFYSIYLLISLGMAHYNAETKETVVKFDAAVFFSFQWAMHIVGMPSKRACISIVATVHHPREWNYTVGITDMTTPSTRI